MAMEATLKAKWLEALRSGEYQQGAGCLRNDDKYCCLGVLADVSNTGEWEGDNFRFASTIGSEWPVASAFFSSEREKSFGIQAHTTELMRMNDNAKKSFAEIADYIEANL